MATCVRAEDLLAAILSSTEDGLLSFTLDGIVQSWSRGAEFLYGYREAEIVSQPLAQLLQSNDPRKFDGLLHAAIRGEFPQCENTERLHKDGSSIFLAVSRAPIRNEHGTSWASWKPRKQGPRAPSKPSMTGTSEKSLSKCPWCCGPRICTCGLPLALAQDSAA